MFMGTGISINNNNIITRIIYLLHMHISSDNSCSSGSFHFLFLFETRITFGFTLDNKVQYTVE